MKHCCECCERKTGVCNDRLLVSTDAGISGLDPFFNAICALLHPVCSYNQ